MKQPTTKLPRLPKPYNTLLDVLYRICVRRRKGISERETGYNGFRARISDLKRIYGMKKYLQYYVVPFENRWKYNNAFRIHYVEDKDQLNARKLYLKLHRLFKNKKLRRG